MLGQLRLVGDYLATEGNIGLTRGLVSIGAEPAQATGFAAAGLLTIGAAVSWNWRKSDLLDLFAVAAYVGRFWTYHRVYDDVMLVFLSLAVVRAAARDTTRRTALVALSVVITLALPARLQAYPAVQLAQIVIWTVGLSTVLRATGLPRGPAIR